MDRYGVSERTEAVKERGVISMTAKELFEKIDEAERNLSTAVRKVEVLKSIAERITSSLQDEVVSHSINVHSHEESIIRLSEAKDALNLVSANYSSLLDFITKKLALLDNEDDEALLSYYHLSHLPLNDISVRLHHSKTWGYRRYDIAIRNLDIIVSDVSEEDLPQIAG